MTNEQDELSDRQACEEMDRAAPRWYFDWCEREGSMGELRAELARSRNPARPERHLA